MEKMRDFLKKVGTGLKNIVMRFPGVIAFLVVCYLFNPFRDRFGLCNVVNEEIFYLGAYGISMSFILEIVLENLKQKGIRLRLICYGIIAVLLSVLLSTGFFDLRGLKTGYFFSNAALGVLSIVVFINKERGSFEKNCIALFVSAVKAFVLSLSITLGMELLVFSLANLILEIRLYSVYREILLIGIIFIYNFIFLAGVPKVGDELECPKFLKDLLKFVFVPFMLGGSVILSIYLIKYVFILNKSLNMNLLLAIVPIMACSVLVSVFAKLVENKLMEITRKILAVMVIPYVLLSVYLIFRGYVDNGIVFTIYSAVIACIAVIAFVIGILFKNSEHQYIGFLVLAVLLVVASIKPFSPERLIERSQQKRITKIFQKYNMIKDNKIVDSKDISKDDVEKIRRSEECLSFWELSRPDYYGGCDWVHDWRR